MSAVTGPNPVQVRIPKKFRGDYFKPRLTDRINQFMYSFGGSHILIYVAVTAYWLITQTIPWVNAHWDDLFPWVNYAWAAMIHGHNPLAVRTDFPQSPLWKRIRHDYRNGIFEGAFVGGTVLMFFANELRAPAKPGRIRKLLQVLTGYTAQKDAVDRLCCFLRIPNRHQGHRVTPLQLAFFLFSFLFLCLPGNVLGFALFIGVPAALNSFGDHLHIWTVTPAGGTGFAAQEANLPRDAFEAKIIGLMGLFFFGRRVFLKVGLDLQEFLTDVRAERYLKARQEHGRIRAFLTRPPALWPSVYRALFWHKIRMATEPGVTAEFEQHGYLYRWMTYAFLVAIPVAAWKGHAILAAYQAAGGK